METPPIDYDGEICVEFSYHMYGDDIGELKAYSSGDGESRAFFDKSGPDGNQWERASETINIDTDDKVCKEEDEPLIVLSYNYVLKHFSYKMKIQ